MGDFSGDAFNRNDNSPAAVQARTKAQNRANVMQLKLVLLSSYYESSIFRCRFRVSSS